MIAFIYIVSSVFQLEFPGTPRVAPLPWSGVHVPCFFPPAGFFRGFRVRLWSGAPNENIVQNHLNIALLNIFWS